jgi:hypothetical protein
LRASGPAGLVEDLDFAILGVGDLALEQGNQRKVGRAGQHQEEQVVQDNQLRADL